MKEHELKSEKEVPVRPTEGLKAITRTLLTAFSVPIVCGLPELMTIRKQLQLRAPDGLVLAKQPTSPTTFLSGVSMGWVSGGLKAASYANKELICNKISQLRSTNHQKSHRYDAMDRIYASFVVGGIDAVTTQGPSTMRTLLWTNQRATTALSNMPLWMGLRSIYKVGFTTRMLKSHVNAGCYVAIAPLLAEKSKATFPENVAKPVAVLGGGIISGFACTVMDVIGIHICREAVFTHNHVKVPSLNTMYRTLYKQNGLRIFTSGAPWNALVSALAFGTMASVEHLVGSDFFTKAYGFFKQAPNKANAPMPSKPSTKNQDENASVKPRKG